MAGRTSKYSTHSTAIWRGELVCLLAENEEPMTISEMKSKSIALSGVTTQKIGNILSELVDYGTVVRRPPRMGLTQYQIVNDIDNYIEQEEEKKDELSEGQGFNQYYL